MRQISHRIHVLFAGSVLAALTLGACDEDAGEHGPSEQTPTQSEFSPAALGLGDDWFELEPGLWTRSNAEGEQEFAGIGEAGSLHAIASLEEAEADLRRSIDGVPSEEVVAKLAELDRLITGLRSSREPLPVDDVQLRCSPSINVTVDAYPSYCGVSAKASAS